MEENEERLAGVPVGLGYLSADGDAAGIEEAFLHDFDVHEGLKKRCKGFFRAVIFSIYWN